jgi:aspartyl-tRNA(Asn)/glutamyl-tRNA(Gln) amidotransferase subunit A
MEGSSRAVADPAGLSLLEAARLLRSRQLSAAELLAACRRRIAERNGGEPSFDGAPGAVNAWARLYPDLAAEQARAADDRLARQGAAAPLLCGIPIGLKDLFAVEGLPLTASSRVLAGHVARRSSAAWQRLADAGMVLVGHTHTHEFAAGGTTDQVGNPRALDRSAGGSSGGSAAALACGMVPAALGTDTAGSLRIPASLCGVSSIKPTHGLVPLSGIIPLAPSLDHAGPMARSLADCSALLRALADGGGEVTPLMPPPAVTGALPVLASTAARPLSGVTVAVTDRPERIGVASEIAQVLEGARLACEDLGARVISVPAPGDLSGDELNAILLSEVGVYHRRHFGLDAGYRTSVREFVAQSRDFTDVGVYLRAQLRRARVTAAWEDWFRAHEVDAVLEPATPTTAPLRGSGYDAGHAAGQGDPLIRLTATWNVTGFPVMTMPGGLGRSSGLPAGVSLIGPRGSEARVLQIAIDLQTHALHPLPAAEPRIPA